MLYVNVSATGLYQNDKFTQYYSHMISFTINTVNGVQNISPIVMPVAITILRENPLLRSNNLIEKEEHVMKC